MQTLMLGKTLAAGEIPLTRPREEGREKERQQGRAAGKWRESERERERGEVETRRKERESSLRYDAFSKVNGPYLPAIST